MTIYLDSDYCCHAEAAEGRRAFDVPFFDGKCREFIEGYRYIPAGEVWQRGRQQFTGEMIAPHRNYHVLAGVQHEFREAQMADMGTALAILGGGEIE